LHHFYINVFFYPLLSEQMKTKAFFVAATGQNVGKTTTCLGLIAGLKNRFSSVGYLKPIGQETVEVASGGVVDKDVALFRSTFSLTDPDSEMSPVLLPKGFTRDYLDEKVSRDGLIETILKGYHSITSRHPMTVVEGTGHMGVGSIIDLNNAQVASIFKTPILLVASGGLGSTFDEIELNRALCELHHVKVAGIVLNRVLPEKREMILTYVSKALKKHSIPLLGAIPFDSLLNSPSMGDFELLFDTEMIAGKSYRWRHYEQIRLLSSSSELERNPPESFQLMITPAEREEILLSLAKSKEQIGILLTGRKEPKASVLEKLKEANIPVLYARLPGFVVLKTVNTHISKIRGEDLPKIQEAIEIVNKHVDFNALDRYF
jgi:phosphate acetyltransferase